VVDALNSLPENNRFMRGLRAWVGYKQTGVHMCARSECLAAPPTHSEKLCLGAKSDFFILVYALDIIIGWRWSR